MLKSTASDRLTALRVAFLLSATANCPSAAPRIAGVGITKS